MGECSLDELRWVQRPPLARQARRDAETGEADLPAPRVDEYVAGFDVLVYETRFVQARNGVRHTDGEPQECFDGRARNDGLIERPRRRRLEHQHGLPVLTHELQWPERPRGVEGILEIMLMPETADRGGR